MRGVHFMLTVGEIRTVHRQRLQMPGLLWRDVRLLRVGARGW